MQWRLWEPPASALCCSSGRRAMTHAACHLDAGTLIRHLLQAMALYPHRQAAASTRFAGQQMIPILALCSLLVSCFPFAAVRHISARH